MECVQYGGCVGWQVNIHVTCAMRELRLLTSGLSNDVIDQ